MDREKSKIDVVNPTSLGKKTSRVRSNANCSKMLIVTHHSDNGTNHTEKKELTQRFRKKCLRTPSQTRRNSVSAYRKLQHHIVSQAADEIDEENDINTDYTDSPKTLELASNLFAILDVDQDGILTHGVLRQNLSEIDPELFSADILDECLDQMDYSKTINEQEFTDAICVLAGATTVESMYQKIETFKKKKCSRKESIIPKITDSPIHWNEHGNDEYVITRDRCETLDAHLKRTKIQMKNLQRKYMKEAHTIMRENDILQNESGELQLELDRMALRSNQDLVKWHQKDAEYQAIMEDMQKRLKTAEIELEKALIVKKKMEKKLQRNSPSLFHRQHRNLLETEKKLNAIEIEKKKQEKNLKITKKQSIRNKKTADKWKKHVDLQESQKKKLEEEILVLKQKVKILTEENKHNNQNKDDFEKELGFSPTDISQGGIMKATPRHLKSDCGNKLSTMVHTPMSSIDEEFTLDELHIQKYETQPQNVGQNYQNSLTEEEKKNIEKMKKKLEEEKKKIQEEKIKVAVEKKKIEKEKMRLENEKKRVDEEIKNSGGQVAFFSGLSKDHPHFNKIGAFKKQTERYNGKGIFKQVHGNFYIWCSPDQYWMIGGQKYIGTKTGFIASVKQSKEDSPYDYNGQWEAWLTIKWVTIAELKCHQEHIIFFSGISKEHPHFNKTGAFKEQTKLYNGMASFKQVYGNFSLWKSPDQFWMIGDHQSIGTKIGFIASVNQTKEDSPCNYDGQWEIWSNRKWITISKLVCRQISSSFLNHGIMDFGTNSSIIERPMKYLDRRSNPALIQANNVPQKVISEMMPLQWVPNTNHLDLTIKFSKQSQSFSIVDVFETIYTGNVQYPSVFFVKSIPHARYVKINVVEK